MQRGKAASKKMESSKKADMITERYAYEEKRQNDEG
jgi:hypothetical protein